MPYVVIFFSLRKSNDMHGYDTDDDVELPVLTSRNGELGRLSRLGRESRTGRESRAIGDYRFF